MMKKVLFVLLITATFLCSCTTTKYYSLADSYWKKYGNATKNEIYRSFGVPTRTVSMNDGEYVLVYEKYVTSTTTNSYSNTNANANATVGSYYTTDQTYANVYGNSSNYSGSNTSTSNNRYFTEFYMNKNDRCYSLRTTDTYGKTETNVGMTILAVAGGIGFVAIFVALLGSMH